MGKVILAVGQWHSVYTKRALEEKREERIAMIQGLLMFVCGTAFGFAIAAAWLPSNVSKRTPARSICPP